MINNVQSETQEGFKIPQNIGSKSKQQMLTGKWSDDEHFRFL